MGQRGKLGVIHPYNFSSDIVRTVIYNAQLRRGRDPGFGVIDSAFML